jgi:hypothetical protein
MCPQGEFCCLGGVGEAAVSWVIGAGVMIPKACTRLGIPCKDPILGLQITVDDTKGQMLMEVDGVAWLSSWFESIAAGWLGSSRIEVQGKNIHARVTSVASCLLAEHWPVTCSREGPSVNVIYIVHTPTLHIQEATKSWQASSPFHKKNIVQAHDYPLQSLECYFTQ